VTRKLKITCVGADLVRPVPLLALGVGRKRASAGPGSALAKLDSRFGGRIGAVMGRDFRGGAKDELLLYSSRTGEDGDPGPERVLLLGTGEPENGASSGMDSACARMDSMRGVAARALRRADRLGLPAFALGWVEDAADDHGSESQAAAEGAVLASWSFRELRSDREDGEDRGTVASLELAGGDEKAARIGGVLGEAANFARTLQARPGNLATPSALARSAEKMAAAVGLGCVVFDEKRMAAEGMEAILAVSKGSAEEARLIVLEHLGGEPDDAPLALVGKGLSFDAGGISLKPPLRMEEMKYDMSGGAAVIAAMKAIAELDLPVNVLGVVPSSENLPSGTAVKPGDVIGTRAGKSVEVVNTDAEGRLVLADALDWVSDRNPRAVVDCATLTGAAVVALGRHASAVLGTDDELAAQVVAAGERSGERCWRLPLWPAYRDQLRSECADLANVGGRAAGTITAAAFLREFVDDTPWAHIDIAGTAYGKALKPYQSKGPHGLPTRLLVEWALARTR